MKKKVLIITYPAMSLTTEQRATLYAKYEAAASVLGVQLLFLTDGATAVISDISPVDVVTTTPLNESRPRSTRFIGEVGPELHIASSRADDPNDSIMFIRFGREERLAIQLVEKLINRGELSQTPWKDGVCQLLPPEHPDHQESRHD